MGWDPLSSEDWKGHKATNLGRINKELSNIVEDPPPGIFAVPDEEDIMLVHALIIGPENTPYQGGFFYFLVRYSPDHPFCPPRVRLMTTGDGTVRFNPNLYREGKVCLSMLGTWSGPQWSPANNLHQVLLSILSVMNEKPYHNEPGFEEEQNPDDCLKYNKIIQHETIRVAVIEVLEKGENSPHMDIIKKLFPQFYSYYETVLKENLQFDGQAMEDPFEDEHRPLFSYASLLQRLEALKEKYKSLFDSESGVEKEEEGTIVETV